MEEWDKHMHDFTPADMITTHISAGAKEVLFETVTQVPSYIRGAFFLENYGDEDQVNFNFKVIDSRGHVLSNKINKKEGLFYLNVTRKGIYTFEFDNSAVNNYFLLFSPVSKGNIVLLFIWATVVKLILLLKI